MSNEFLVLFNKLITNVIARIKSVAPKAAIAAYALTTEGRAELRSEGKGIMTKNPGCLSLLYHDETARNSN